MKITLSELRDIIAQQINEALTPANKLALRFMDFYKAYDERDFDRAVTAFVDEDNEKMIPWEDEQTGERGMMARGKSKAAKTTAEKVLNAYVTYGGRPPASSRFRGWIRTKPISKPGFAPTRGRGASSKALVSQEPRSGRRASSNALIPSAGLSRAGPTKTVETGFIRDPEMKRDLYAAIEGISNDYGDVDGGYNDMASAAMSHLESDPEHWVNALTRDERRKVLQQMANITKEIFG